MGKTKLVCFVANRKARRFRMKLCRVAAAEPSVVDFLESMKVRGWTVCPPDYRPQLPKFKRCASCGAPHRRREFARRQWLRSVPVCLECAKSKVQQDIRDSRALRDAAVASFVPPTPRSDTMPRREVVGAAPVHSSPGGSRFTNHPLLAFGRSITADMTKGFKLVECESSGDWIRVSFSSVGDEAPPMWVKREHTQTYLEMLQNAKRIKALPERGSAPWRAMTDLRVLTGPSFFSPLASRQVWKGDVFREFERKECACSGVTWLRISDIKDPEQRWIQWLHIKDLRQCGDALWDD